MNEGKIRVSISIDIRKYRIRIHKSTLNQLGPPAYIQLLINPTNGIIAIQGLEKRCKEAHAVSFTRLKTDNSYELYSQQLITILMPLLPESDSGCTYRLTGEVHIDEKTALFPLNTIQRVEGGV